MLILIIVGHVYKGNDAQFSESDYKSLARIGQGSKLDKLSATGTIYPHVTTLQ